MTTDTVTVTQKDRMRAVAIMADRWHSKHRAEVSAGQHDNWIPVQECAAHRIAGEKAERERAAKVAEDFDDPDPDCISDRIAQAIRGGQHGAE